MKQYLSLILLLTFLLSCEKKDEEEALPSPYTVMDLLEEQDDLSRFTQAIYEEDLEELLRSEPELTIFAIPDDKFPESGFVIWNHIVKGKTLLVDSFPAYETLTPLTGHTNRVFVFDGKTMIEDAEIVQGDLLADNGVVHIMSNYIEYNGSEQRIILDEKGLKQRIGSLYFQTTKYLDYYFLLTALVSDEANSIHPKWSPFDTHTLNPANSELLMLWRNLAWVEYETYHFLEDVQEARADKAIRERYSSEAKAIRALAYFYNINLWGDLIVYDYENEKANGRRDVKEVYATIVTDLTEALEHLPQRDSDSQALNTFSLQFFLAKAHAYQGEWGLAKARLENIINAQQYHLSTTVEEGLKNPEEVILGFRWPEDPLITILPDLHSSSHHKASDDLISLYAQNDQRLNKYIEPATGQIQKFYPQRIIPFIRYSEVLLLYAEAQQALEEPGALETLNKIRQRAGLELYENKSSADLKEAIQEERRRELAFEGNRFLDLKRTNKYLEEMQKKGENVSEKDLLLPFPAEIIYHIGSSYQNPGY